MGEYQKVYEVPAKLIVMPHRSGSKLLLLVVSPDYPKTEPEVRFRVDDFREIVFKRGRLDG